MKANEEKMREKIARIVYENGCPDEECDRHETRTCKQCTEETADKILALLNADKLCTLCGGKHLVVKKAVVSLCPICEPRLATPPKPDEPHKYKDCQFCNGTGKSKYLTPIKTIPCDLCEGRKRIQSGEDEDRACPKCNGSGKKMFL